jgi:hypothetical protein
LQQPLRDDLLGQELLLVLLEVLFGLVPDEVRQVTLLAVLLDKD